MTDCKVKRSLQLTWGVCFATFCWWLGHTDSHRLTKAADSSEF